MATTTKTLHSRATPEGAELGSGWHVNERLSESAFALVWAILILELLGAPLISSGVLLGPILPYDDSSTSLTTLCGNEEFNSHLTRRYIIIEGRVMFN